MYDESNEYKIRMHFLNLIDGGYDFEPVFEGINSFRVGICKLEFINNVFHIYLRRPGLLIGKKGETINKISKELNVKIHLHEINLLKEN